MQTIKNICYKLSNDQSRVYQYQYFDRVGKIHTNKRDTLLILILISRII